MSQGKGGATAALPDEQKSGDAEDIPENEQNTGPVFRAQVMVVTGVYNQIQSSALSNEELTRHSRKRLED